MANQNSSELPEIPTKRYFTIGEASTLCGVKSHVLRYWEQEFTQLKPMKRRGNRRYYQREDIELVRRIRRLLYDDGFTIQGARTKISDAENKHIIVKKPISKPEFDVSGVITELEDVLAMLSD